MTDEPQTDQGSRNKYADLGIALGAGIGTAVGWLLVIWKFGSRLASELVLLLGSCSREEA